MRKAFVESVLKHATDKSVFLTADLGFNALEPVQEALGPRFINAGVAEQNMIGAAAGLALSGMSPWCYSIAPFLYARCFEQIRNDLCWHKLPVKLVGNGGGYGYGVMGASHHAIDDYGVLLTMPGMKVFVPAFDEDVERCVQAMLATPGPSYLRLGMATAKTTTKPEPWRRLIQGNSWAPVIAVVGPLAGDFLNAMSASTGATLWVCCEPGCDPPYEFYQDMRGGVVAVVEEHVEQGSLGQRLAHEFFQHGIQHKRFRHFCASSDHADREGSQSWHRRRDGIDAASVMKALEL